MKRPTAFASAVVFFALAVLLPAAILVHAQDPNPGDNYVSPYKYLGEWEGEGVDQDHTILRYYLTILKISLLAESTSKVTMTLLVIPSRLHEVEQLGDAVLVGTHLTFQGPRSGRRGDFVITDNNTMEGTTSLPGGFDIHRVKLVKRRNDVMPGLMSTRVPPEQHPTHSRSSLSARILIRALALSVPVLTAQPLALRAEERPDPFMTYMQEIAGYDSMAQCSAETLKTLRQMIRDSEDSPAIPSLLSQLDACDERKDPSEKPSAQPRAPSSSTNPPPGRVDKLQRVVPDGHVP